jgi:hypothetical protein
VLIVLKSESLSFLEALEPVQACNGIALTFMYFSRVGRSVTCNGIRKLDVCTRRSDVCPIGMQASQKGCATNLVHVYKDLNMEKLLVENNRTELVNWID